MHLISYTISYFTNITVSYWCFWIFSQNSSVLLTDLKDWDKPETIPDPDAKKPDDWDEEMDGEWEPPMVTNPDYKVHKAPLINTTLLLIFHWHCTELDYET